jgi:hypothetical protein
MIPKSISSKQYPNFIRKSRVFEKQKDRQSIFPHLGLRNCRTKITKNMTDNENFIGKWIVFSSSGEKGRWDIATMSERGTPSCMQWSGKPTELIGSMVDPCVGIVYITDGTKTKKGEAMYARSLVRYVVNNKGKEALLLEQTYTDDDKDEWLSENYSEFDKLVGIVLKSKTKPRMTISPYKGGYYIPLTKSVKKMIESYDLEESWSDRYDEWLSLSDAGARYGKPKKLNKTLKAIGV